jgi:hypothetical protein
MPELVKFPRQCSLANTSGDVIAELEVFKQDLAEGRFGDITRMVIVMEESDGHLSRYTIGPAGTCKITTVGMLTWAAHKCMNGD